MSVDLPTRQRPRGQQGVGGVIAIVVAVGAAVVLYALIASSEPDFVPELTIENPTDTRLHVAVTSSPDEGRLGIGTVEPSSSLTLGSVIDQGPTWIFVVGWREVRIEVSRTRQQLADDGWTVRLPQEAADAVKAQYPPLPSRHRAPAS